MCIYIDYLCIYICVCVYDCNCTLIIPWHGREGWAQRNLVSGKAWKKTSENHWTIVENRANPGKS